MIPYWEGIKIVLDNESHRLVRLLGEGGVELMLSSLHPTISWQAPHLTISTGPPDRDVGLEGAGVTIVPSLFCLPGRPLCDAIGPDGPAHLLFYPLPASYLTRFTRRRVRNRDLQPLLGATRARVLAAVGEGACSTTELARRCDTSLATASEHAAVLRTAGLLDTRRDGTAVRHDVTLLGASLLGAGVHEC